MDLLKNLKDWQKFLLIMAVVQMMILLFAIVSNSSSGTHRYYSDIELWENYYSEELDEDDHKPNLQLGD